MTLSLVMSLFFRQKYNPKRKKYKFNLVIAQTFCSMKDTLKNEMISDRLEEHICKGKIYKFISTDLIKDT
jgi:hypothetical protein